MDILSKLRPGDPPKWFDAFPWLFAYLLFSLLLELFEQMLNCRQLVNYKNSEVPEEISEMITTEAVQKSNSYNAEKLQFDMLHSAVKYTSNTWLFVLFAYPALWSLAGYLVGTNEFLRSLAFLGLQIPIGILEGLPFELYRDFVIEARHGFNKKTLRLFIKDEVIQIILQVVIGAPVTCIIIFLVKWAAESFFIWVWGFSVIFTFFIMTIYPNFIAPLFNDFVALQDEELRLKINALALQLRFPLTAIYQMDGSKRSAHSNAYLYGFWKNKRIVLYDTLLDLPHNQILAILGHELGHWKRKHAIKGIVLSFAQIFAMLWLFELVIKSDALFTSFGFPSSTVSDRPVVIGLFLFSMIYSPISIITGVCFTMLSRFHEFQADEFAVSLGFGENLKGGLLQLFKQNLGSIHPDKWFAWYHYSHPPLVERLQALNPSDKSQ